MMRGIYVMISVEPTVIDATEKRVETPKAADRISAVRNAEPEKTHN